MKNIKIILLINIIVMIIESSKIVKIHFVSFIFFRQCKRWKDTKYKRCIFIKI